MNRLALIIIITALFTACSSDVEKQKGVLSKNEMVMSQFANGAAQVTWEYGDVDGKRLPVYQREYNEDSTLFKAGPLKGQRREGEWKSYYRDGTLWSENIYKNGLINGKTITYFPIFSNNKQCNRISCRCCIMCNDFNLKKFFT